VDPPPVVGRAPGMGGYAVPAATNRLPVVKPNEQPRPVGAPPMAWGPAGYPPTGYPQPVFVPVQTQQTNGLAIASLILGLLWLSGLGSILAVILGHVALHQIRVRGEGGRGLAIAGAIIGWVGVAVVIAVIIVLVATRNSVNNYNYG
jgi:hypothetical protein